jgi:hypothetical protein
VCLSTGKPYLVIDLPDEGNQAAALHAARNRTAANQAGGILNVTGPRASKHLAVNNRAKALLRA